VREVGIGGAEVVAPFRDAVGFVDGDAGKLTLGVDGLKVAAEGFREGEFRGDSLSIEFRRPAYRNGDHLKPHSGLPRTCSS